MRASDSSAASPTHARIVTGARQHFFAHGFRGVTMDDLARELGMSKKTLYACFPGKLDLVRAVVAAKASEIDADLQRITSVRARHFPETLSRMLACFQKHVGEIQPPFVRDMRRENPELFQTIEGMRRQLLQRHFGTLLEHGRKAGVVRKDIAPRIVIEILLGAVQAVASPHKVEELGITPKTALLTVIRVVLEGVLLEKGRA